MKSKVYKFKNGARIIYKRCKDFDVTSAYIGFLCGNDRDEGKHGLPHLLEHVMMSCETKTRSYDEVKDDSINVTFFNAATNRYFVMGNFSEISKLADKCIMLLADQIFDHNPSEETLKQQIDVILNEKKMYETREYTKFGQQSYYLRIKNAYTNDKIFGEDERLKNYTLKDLQDFKAKNFVASNFVASVTSSLPFWKIKKIIKKHCFSKLESKHSEPSVYEYVPCDYVKGDNLFTIERDIPTYSIGIYFYYPTEKNEFRYDYTFSLIMNFLRKGSTSLYENLRKQGLIYTAFFDCNDDETNALTGNFSMVFETKDYQNIDKIIKTTNLYINNLLNGALNEAFLSTWKEYYEKLLRHEKYTFTKERCFKNVNRYCERGELKFLTTNQQSKLVQGLTLERVQSVINRVFDKNNDLHVVMMGDFKDKKLKTVKQYKNMLFK